VRIARERPRTPLGAASMARSGFRLMGIVNVTPDSFSDGGTLADADAAMEHARALAAEGAQLIDVGGESTRPGASAIDTGEELRRVLPVLEGLAGVEWDERPPQVSIDTSTAPVAAAAIAAGASLVNDVSALRADERMAAVVAEAGTDCCLVHMLGLPGAPWPSARYDDVVDDVKAFLHERIEFAVGAGIAEERLLIDPGIGFAKTLEHNLTLLARLDEIAALGPPVVVGTSRKSFLARIAGEQEDPRRLAGTIATNVLALERGAAVFRVHEVAPVRAALQVAAATLGEPWTKSATARTRTS
jgi:dihydropteroate synthase